MLKTMEKQPKFILQGEFAVIYLASSFCKIDVKLDIVSFLHKTREGVRHPPTDGWLEQIHFVFAYCSVCDGWGGGGVTSSNFVCHMCSKYHKF